MMSLSYAVREKVETDYVLPPQAEGKTHSEKYGYVELDMIHLESHDHSWHRENKSKVYHIIEDFTRGTVHVGSIKPFQKRKDGRDASISVMLQHSGPDKRTALLQACGSHLHTGQWKSNNNFLLSEHASKQLQSYVEMTQCSE